MKFCHQCRALIDREAKFCNQCGAVIANMPLCPRCGDPIGPEEKFCGVCGLPFTSAAPAQQSPARPVVPPTVPPPSQPMIQPKPAGSRGISLGKILAGIVVVLVIIVGIIMILPDSPPPPPGGGTTAGGTVPTGEEPLRVQQSERESRQMLDAAATALENRDIATFSQSVYPKDLARLGSPLVFQSGGEESLAAVLRNAQVAESYKGIIYYTSDSDGSPIQFTTIKEGELWFISGL
jgi:RNA polymerase subunit RPABC4/transcription elongation factor Spt4